MQLSLLNKKELNNYQEEDFVISDEISKPYEILTKFFNQENYQISPIQNIFLNGPKYCGKTHLLNILSKKKNVVKFTSKTELSNLFQENYFYIFEDIDEVTNQELLFNIINLAKEEGAFLIFTSSEEVKFSLKDLNSRFKNFFKITIENPSVNTIKQLLINYLSRKQITLSGNILNYITTNIKRDYETLFKFVDLLDKKSNSLNSKISLKDVEELIL